MIVLPSCDAYNYISVTHNFVVTNSSLIGLKSHLTGRNSCLVLYTVYMYTMMTSVVMDIKGRLTIATFLNQYNS